MASRAATREFGHFLVKYDDGTWYTCSRVKIITDGRVRIGERYPVVYGSSICQPEYATVHESGDYLAMKNLETEHADDTTTTTITSPTQSPSSSISPKAPSLFRLHKRKRPASKPTHAAKKPATLISIAEGTSDPYEYRSPSTSPILPAYLSALSLVSPATNSPTATVATQTTPTHKEPAAFSLQKALAAMCTQLEIQNARQSEMERLLVGLQTKLYYVLVHRPPVVSPMAQSMPQTPRTPTLPPRRLLPELASTPTTPTLPLRLPDFRITPTTPIHQLQAPQRRALPMHLFHDIPESVRLTENDLNNAVYSSATPGALAVILLKHFYPELFTADQLHVYYSYQGGGKLGKRPIDETRKTYIRRYVSTFYPEVNLDSNYYALVIEKINHFLHRPIQQKK